MVDTIQTLDELRAYIVEDVLDMMIDHPHQDDIRIFLDAKPHQMRGFMGSIGRDILIGYCKGGSHFALRDVVIETFILDTIIEIHSQAVARFRRSLFSLK